MPAILVDQQNRTALAGQFGFSRKYNQFEQVFQSLTAQEAGEGCVAHDGGFFRAFALRNVTCKANSAHDLAIAIANRGFVGLVPDKLTF